MRDKYNSRLKARRREPFTFVDIFAGCGGLSLGLSRAGLVPRFSAEKHPDAFETLRTNLLNRGTGPHLWPNWLPVAPVDVVSLARDHSDGLLELRGKVDLLAGGPPCQGFSMNGKRNTNDPRNQLVESYIEIVKLLSPRMLLLENVRGFTSMQHASGAAFATYVGEKLEKLGYKVWSDVVAASAWGVPQRRERFFIVGAKENLSSKLDPFADLDRGREAFLSNRGLPTRPVTVAEAIADLETRANKLAPDPEDGKAGFSAVASYKGNEQSAYANLMRGGSNDIPTDLRLPRHTERVRRRFERILEECKKGRVLSDADRARFGLKKRTLAPLAPDKPSHTVTTLPDDMIHYSEARILTVRECARLQSFPDWFCFKGPYTTGGMRRRNACPRYTQVGNAVPPLLAEALGEMLVSCLEKLGDKADQEKLQARGACKSGTALNGKNRRRARPTKKKSSLAKT